MEEINKNDNKKFESKKLLSVAIIFVLLLLAIAGVVIYFNQDKLASATTVDENDFIDDEYEYIADDMLEDYEEIDPEEANNTFTELVNEEVINKEDFSEIAEVNSDTNLVPIAVVNYSTTRPTSRSVTVTISSNQELKPVSGWTLSSDKTRLTKMYNANASEKVTIESLAGIQNTANVKIENIDKTL